MGDMGTMGSMDSLLQLAASQQGYPPLPPSRPKDLPKDGSKIPPADIHTYLDYLDLLPGFEEWQTQGAPPGSYIYGNPKEHGGEEPTDPPGPRVPGYNEQEFDIRRALMHALAHQYGWNI